MSEENDPAASYAARLARLGAGMFLSRSVDADLVDAACAAASSLASGEIPDPWGAGRALDVARVATLADGPGRLAEASSRLASNSPWEGADPDVLFAALVAVESARCAVDADADPSLPEVRAMRDVLPPYEPAPAPTVGGP